MVQGRQPRVVYNALKSSPSCQAACGRGSCLLAASEICRIAAPASFNRAMRIDGEIARLHNRCMDVAYISALSALAGSVVGGLTSGIATWLSQRAQVKAGRLEHELSRREQLYKDFIIAASKAYGDAMVSNDPQIPVIVDLYAMVSIMRVVSAPQTLARAEEIMHATTQTYLEPNMTARELHERVKRGNGIDPLKEFSEAARAELRSFTPR